MKCLVLFEDISQTSVSEPWWKETHQPVISSYKVCMNGRVTPTIGGKLLHIRSEEFTLAGGTQNPGYKQKEWNPTTAILQLAALSGWGQGLWKAEGNGRGCKGKKDMIRCDRKSRCLEPINVCFKM